MYRLISILLTAILVLPLCGCSQKNLNSPSVDIPQLTGTTPGIVHTAPPSHQADIKVISVTENVPIFDAASTDNRVVPSEQQNPDLYQSTYLKFNGLAHMDPASYAVTICEDEVELSRGNHYSLHVVEGNVLRKLDNIHFSKTYNLHGRSHLLEFDYVIYNGTPFITYSVDNEDTTCYPHLRLLGSEYVWMAIFIEPNVGYHYYFLDPETGELTSLFQNLDQTLLDNLPAQNETPFYLTMLDRNRFLLQAADNDFYYFDTAKGIVRNITELVGTDLTSCIFAGEDIVCIYEDTHDVSTVYVDFWKVDTSDFTAKLLLTNIKGATRIPYVFKSQFGSRCNLSFTFFRLNGEYHMYDLVNEQDTVITVPDNWIWGANIYASPDGRKFFTANENGILVLDCDTMEFSEFKLADPNGGIPYTIMWTSDGAIVKWVGSNYYIYSLK